VQSEGWQEVLAEASVHPDAEYLTISVDYGGTEPAWVDAVSITVLGEAPASRTAALRSSLRSRWSVPFFWSSS
jgi:hypothetical protein